MAKQKEDLGEKGPTYRVKIDPPEGPKRLVPSFTASPSLPEPQRTLFRGWVADHTASARELALTIVKPSLLRRTMHGAVATMQWRFTRTLSPAPFPRDAASFGRTFARVVRDVAHRVNQYSAGCYGGWSWAHNWFHDDVYDTAGSLRAADGPSVFDVGFPNEPFARSRWLNREISAALRKLSTMQRKIIVETWLVGRKRAVVAQRLGISIKTYDAHVQAALSRMREALVTRAQSAVSKRTHEAANRVPTRSMTRTLDGGVEVKFSRRYDQHEWYDEILARNDAYLLSQAAKRERRQSKPVSRPVHVGTGAHSAA